MVQLTDLGASAGFAYTAWSVLGSLHRYIATANKRFDDGTVVDWHATLLAELVSQGDRTETTMGMDPSQRQIFEHWKALNTTQKCTLLESLAQLVYWSGQAQRFPALQRCGPAPKWGEMSEQARKELLVAADQLNFDFVEEVLQDGEYVSGNQSLWQITEAPAMLSAEPLVMRDAARLAGAVREMIPHLEARVKAAFGKAKESKVQALKDSAVDLNILAVMKQLAELQVALQKQVGLNSEGRKKRCAELKAALEELALEPASAQLVAAKQAASEALDAAVAEAVVELQAQQAQQQEEVAAKAGEMEMAARVGAVAKTPGDVIAAVAAAEALLGHLSSQATPALATAQLKLLKDATSRLCLAEEQAEQAQQLLQQLEPKPEAPKPAPVEPKPAQEGEEGAEASAAEEEAAPAEEPVNVAEVLSQLAALVAAMALPEPEQPAAEEAEAEAEAEKEGGEGEEAEEAEEAEGEAEAEEKPAPKPVPSAAEQKDAAKEAISSTVATAASGAKAKLAEAHAKQLAEARARERASQLDLKFGGLAELEAGEALLVRERYCRQVATAAMAGESLVPRAEELLGGLDSSQLAEESAAAVAKAQTLASEAALIESITKLELGADTGAVLAQVQEYLKAQEAQVSEEDGAVDVVSEPLEQVGALLGDGLVALGLSGQQYRKLRELKEVVGDIKADGEGLQHDRHIRLLKELVQQLGPIGAAVQARLGEAQDEQQRALLQAQKDLALGLYEQLSSYLAYEDDVQGAGLKALASAKESLAGAQVNRSSAVVGATLNKLAAALGQLQEVGAKLAELPDEPAAEAAAEGAEAAAEESAASAAASAAVEVASRVAKVQEVAAYYMQFVKLREMALGSGAAAPPADLETTSLADLKIESELPLAVVADTEEEEVDSWRAAGLQHIAHGRVAVLLAATKQAGGAPALCQDVGLASGKSIAQLFAERLLRLQRLAAEATFGRNSGAVAPIHWYIMTSPATHAATVSFFQRHKHFGLSPRQVTIFSHTQRAPLLSEDLKIISENPVKLAQQADSVSAGDLLVAMGQSGALRHLAGSGARYLDVQAVEDNLLARLADPVLLGYLASEGLDVAAKVVEPSEVEASYQALAGSLGEEMRSTLAFTAPATGQYTMTAAFFRAAAKHVQDDPSALYRLVPQADIAGRGAQVSGYRLQRQLADLLLPDTLAALGGANAGLLGVDCKEEFSQVFGSAPWHPVEEDHAVGDLMELTSTWVEASGGEVTSDQGVEVSPLVSYAGEGLQGVCEGVSFAEPYDTTLQGAAAGAGQPRTNAGPWLAPVVLASAAVAVLKAVGGSK